MALRIHVSMRALLVALALVFGGCGGAATPADDVDPNVFVSHHHPNGDDSPDGGGISVVPIGDPGPSGSPVE